jgi:signal transduction histidine kinase
MVLYNQGEIEKDKLIYFLPKLETDIKYISFTLNNLLSWGRMQMKADITKPIPVDLEGILTENINLLSEIAFQKSIAVLNKVELNTVVWADRDQIDIVIRNLISNALKFTPENGSVTITAIDNNSNWEVSIQDTGIGMDQNTQNKIFDRNSNITTYGTNNEKGTGLGINLCKELIENNMGTLVVHSIPNQGSCFKFILAKPKLMVNQNYSISAGAHL